MIATVGEILIESLCCLEAMPAANTTMVLNGVDLRIGGPAYNIARHLASLGQRPGLISMLGRTTSSLVLEAIEGAELDPRWLIHTEGAADVLFSMQLSDGDHSVFQRSELSVAIVSNMRAACLVSTHLVLAGSRHAALRHLYVDVAKHFDGETLIFAPNYAIFLFSRAEIAEILRHAHVTCVNEREASHLVTLFELVDEASLASLTRGILIVTREAQGAMLFGDGEPVLIPSLSGSLLNVIGAGDAFLAGFMHARLKGASLVEAGRWAAAAAAVFIDDAEQWPSLNTIRIDERLRSGRPLQTANAQSHPYAG